MTRVVARGVIVASLMVVGLFGFGCGSSDNGSTLGAQFTASATPAAPHLIKLVPKAASGSRIVVQAVIYGPDTALDMYAFGFDVTIGDTAVLAYVPNSAVAGDALVPFAGQTIQALASPDQNDASHIVVGVSKLGGGLGNGVAGDSAVVVEMTFNVLKQGTSTLAIATTPAPAVYDHDLATIGVIAFDAASGAVTGF